MEQEEPTPKQPGDLQYASKDLAPSGPAPDIWVSAIVGLVLLLMSSEFVGWLLAAVQGKSYETGVVWTQGTRQGQNVAYWELQGHQALSQSAIFAFGVALLAEAAAMFIAYRYPAKARQALVAALAITLAATLYNVVAMVVLLGDGQKPIISLLAVAFGGYMVITQGRMLRRARPSAV